MVFKWAGMANEYTSQPEFLRISLFQMKRLTFLSLRFLLLSINSFFCLFARNLFFLSLKWNLNIFFFAFFFPLDLTLREVEFRFGLELEWWIFTIWCSTNSEKNIHFWCVSHYTAYSQKTAIRKIWNWKFFRFIF